MLAESAGLVSSVAGRTGDIVLVVGDVSGAAPLASPTFTGTPAAPTPSTADNSTKLATTAFVKAQGYLTSAPVTSVVGQTGAITAAQLVAAGLVGSAGVSGGQTIDGGTGASENLTLVSTAHATKGKVILATGSTYVDSAGNLTQTSGQIFFPDGSSANPGVASSGQPSLGWYRDTGTDLALVYAGNVYLQMGASGLRVDAASVIGWSGVAQSAASGFDTSLSRSAAGVIATKSLILTAQSDTTRGAVVRRFSATASANLIECQEQTGVTPLFAVGPNGAVACYPTLENTSVVRLYRHGSTSTRALDLQLTGGDQINWDTNNADTIFSVGGTTKFTIPATGGFGMLDPITPYGTLSLGAIGTTPSRHATLGFNSISNAQSAQATIGVTEANYQVTGAATNDLFLKTISNAILFSVDNGTTANFRINSAGDALFNRNAVLAAGAVATNATNGFLYLATCAGAPTGTPTSYSGCAPGVVDSTNNKLWVYVNGAWKGTVLS